MYFALVSLVYRLRDCLRRSRKILDSFIAVYIAAHAAHAALSRTGSPTFLETLGEPYRRKSVLQFSKPRVRKCLLFFSPDRLG